MFHSSGLGRILYESQFISNFCKSGLLKNQVHRFGEVQQLIFPTSQRQFPPHLSHWLNTPGFTTYSTLLIPLAVVPPLFTAWLIPLCSPTILV